MFTACNTGTLEKKENEFKFSKVRNLNTAFDLCRRRAAYVIVAARVEVGSGG